MRLSDDAQEFAAVLLQNSEDLAMARSKTVDIPLDKYLLMRDFTQSLVFNCYSRVNAKLESERLKETQQLELFWQYLYFFIHLTDRMAISTLPDVVRHSLVHELGQFAITLVLQVLYPQEKDSLFEGAMSGLNMAVSDYSHFRKIMPEGNEGKKNTLLWEFSKQVNRILDLETNLGALVGEELMILSLAKNLDIQSFLDEMK